MVVMTEYAQYMFNLQWNIVKTVVQHCLQIHENATLHSGTLPPLGHDRELQVAYRHLSEAEHGWHYARQQLDAARAMVDERTHATIHLEHHVEQEDLNLEERATTIATLEQ
jgi:hypothetical protein